MQTYTTGWISKKLGITYETLREWIRAGFISPSIAVSEGQGHANLFSLADVFRIVAFKRLTNLGFSRAVAAEMTAGIPAQRETYLLAQCSHMVIVHRKDSFNIKFITQPGGLGDFLTSKLPEDFKDVTVLNTELMWEEIMA